MPWEFCCKHTECLEKCSKLDQFKTQKINLWKLSVFFNMLYGKKRKSRFSNMLYGKNKTLGMSEWAESF